MTQPIIHIHAQQGHHDEAYIVGNRLALSKLHGVLTEVLDLNANGQCEVSTTDGEGYDIHILVTEREDIALPYTEEYAKEKRENVVWPWEMIK